MGGRGFFVWSAYGVTAVCVVAELMWLRHAARQSPRRLARMPEWDKSPEQVGS